MSMLTRFKGWWDWFVEGLVEALLWIVDHVRRRRPIAISLGRSGGEVAGVGGAPLGRLTLGGTDAGFSPPDLPGRIAGAVVDLVVPPNWIARRDLEPVAVASRPFLDAFVRHQIERVTPWRVGDTHYRIFATPVAGDATRLAVAVAVVPRRVVAEALDALHPLHPRDVRLRAVDDPAGDAALLLGRGRPTLVAALRRAVLAGLSATLLAVLGLAGTLQWQAASVRDDIGEQDRVLDARRAVLARERRAADPGGDAAAKLRALRAARPSAVSVIAALSSALPDSAHLTALSIEGDRVTIAGVSDDPSSLVPALETSGDFAAVAFGAATTRAEAGAGDRFTLEMRALPERSDHAAPAPAGGSAPAARGAP